MDDVVQALMIAFGALLFVIGFSVAMYMFSQVTTTAESLALYTDSTLYYDNVKIGNVEIDDSDLKNGIARIVNADTIIPTLYRYADEEFCVKIYDNATPPNLIQIFDLDLEGKVQASIGDTKATENADKPDTIRNYAYKKIYNNYSDTDLNLKKIYMFGVPWLGSKENIKTRIDLFVNGEAGYIGDHYVNYKDNDFYKALKNNTKFKERFISYSWSGETMTTDDGDELVTGNAPKDKIVIIYTML